MSCFDGAGGGELELPDLDVGSGEELVLTGPSGSGKSSCLMVLAGMLTPASGSVTLDGQEWREIPRGKRDRYRGRMVGFVPQEPHLVPTLTVSQNLRLAQYLSGAYQDDARVQATLDAVGMGNFGKRYPTTLSRGQQQRVAVARALVNRPKLLLADEPTASLDDANCLAVLEFLMEGSRQLEATLIVATHDVRVLGTLTHTLSLPGRMES